MPRHKLSPENGFTILELLATLAIAGVLMAIGLPALFNFIGRSKLEGFARQSALLIEAAHFNCIKKASTQSVVYIDLNKRQMVSFEDDDNDGKFDNNDVELARYTLPSDVYFWGPPDAAPNGTNVIMGLTPDPSGTPQNVAILLSDGSIKDAGAFRLGDKNGNYLEVFISPQGTARLQVLKWDGAAWRAPGDNNQAWTWK